MGAEICKSANLRLDSGKFPCIPKGYVRREVLGRVPSVYTYVYIYIHMYIHIYIYPFVYT